MAGTKVDYLSPTLYLVDVVWIGWALSSLKVLKTKSLKIGFLEVVSLAGIGVNILMAANKGAAIMGWIRWGQWLIAARWVAENWEKVKKDWGKILAVWIVGESLLAVAQMVNNGSIGGVFYWLGERKFSLTTVGIAQMAVGGREILRGYGTFSHPNSLAGFLAVAIWWWTKENKKRDWKWWIVFWIGMAGIGVSGSRTVWLAVVVIMGIRWGKWRESLGKMLIMTGVVLAVVGWAGNDYRGKDLLGGWDKKSAEKRWELNLEAVKLIKENPLFGSGWGGFLSRWGEKNGRWIQPVHNVPLLVLADWGVVGIVIFLRFLGVGKRKIEWRENWQLWGLLVVTAMVDHYWVTLPQNRWLVALIWGKISFRDKIG